MNQSGDALGQPGESVESIDDIAGLMGGEEEIESALESEESEASEESEEQEGDESEADEAEEEEQESTVTLKVDGKEITVPQSKAIELAQMGMDYTQKTMAVAEERKAVEQVKAQAEQVRQQVEQTHQQAIAQAQALAQFIESQLGQPPSLDLLHTQGSDVYLAHRAEYEHRQAQLQQVMSGIESMQADAHRQRQAWLTQQADATEQALRETLPGFTDDTLGELAGYMAKSGLTPQNLADAFIQKGLWELAHKAKAYDALQAQKAQIKPKAELPKVAKPKGAPQTPRGIVAKQEAEKRFSRKPSIDTLADLL